MTSNNTNFATLYERARKHDLMSRTVLSSTERFAVLAGGITALELPLETQQDEWQRMLNDGCPAQLLEDSIVQMAAYIGYPKTAVAMQALNQATGRDEQLGQDTDRPSDEERLAIGTDDYTRLNSDALPNIKAAFSDVAPQMVRLTFQSFGDVFARSAQPLPIRQLTTVAALGCAANAAPQLRFHIGAAFNVGVTREQIVETIHWVQFLAGMPAAYNALIEFKASMDAGPGASPGYK